MQKVKPNNKVRFAWWGAEESGLLGSTFYVNSLPAAEQAKIALYLNFDMVGSPNYVRFVYDGERRRRAGRARWFGGDRGASSTTSTPAGGLAFEPTAFDGRSDYGPFIAAGDIPSGGLFTGAEGVKTAAQAAVYGGTAGAAVRPVLPPGVRHVRQQQRRRARPQLRRHRRSNPDVRHEHEDRQRDLAHTRVRTSFHEL